MLECEDKKDLTASPEESDPSPVSPAGEGYRLLKIGEAIGDDAETWVSGMGPWTNTKSLSFAPHVVTESMWPIRVPVTSPSTQGAPSPRFPVPDGWRLLKVRERIEKGDMACSKNAHSFELAAVLTTCYGLYVCGNDKNAYFRPIAIEPAPQATLEPIQKLAPTIKDSLTVDFIKVGDMVRILPIVKDVHSTDDRIIADMVAMVGKEFSVTSASLSEESDDLLLEINGWVFASEWVEKVAPQATESTSPELIHLSEDLKYWRAEQPDEWIMDRFIKKAEALKAQVSTLIDALSQAREALKACVIQLEARGTTQTNADMSAIVWARDVVSTLVSISNVKGGAK